MKRMLTNLRDRLRRHNAMIWRFAFELVIVFVGVTAAFALENYRQESEEDAYRRTVIAAVSKTFGDTATHGRDISIEIAERITKFDAAVARGEQPMLPVYREEGGEGPPTLVWDGLMSTGAMRALDPELAWRLAGLYNELDSVGDRYRRYNAVTESLVFGLDPDHAGAWQDGKLKPEFRAYVEQLRELGIANDRVNRNAEALRADLERQTR